MRRCVVFIFLSLFLLSHQVIAGEIADKLIRDLGALSQEDRIDALEHLRDSLSYQTPRETLGEYILVADYVRNTWADQHHAFLYLAAEIKNIITSLLSGGEGFRVEGVYSNPSIPGSPRIVLLQLGKQLHGNLVQFFTATGEDYWVLPFTEVVFDPKTALIEMFNDGLTPESSYFFQGTVKEGRLQGRFATTSGEMMMLDLLRVERFTVSNPNAQAIAVNDLLGSYLASSTKGVYR
ncbi:MAG TPA: hypothetical protein VJL87_01625, partial [Bdellovibrionota bacterium]|nr:hypothetical protein [Bdellovibrionota bacterium]